MNTPGRSNKLHATGGKKKLTLNEAADELGVSKRTLRRLISSGQLPAVRIGIGTAIVRIDPDDLANVIHPVVPNGKTDEPPRL
jgi:excisionase family DNA binding protein